MINISKEDFIEVVKISLSKSDICRHYGWPIGGAGIRRCDKYLKLYEPDISHFDYGKSKTFKYERIIKICPVCNSEFETLKGHSREKTTCSHSCSNSHFRSGINNPNWKYTSYRSTCFHYHEKSCVVCGENKIVEVHHYDENHDNNEPTNLIPLCPTHHQYVHSRYKNDVIDVIEEYRKKFIESVV